MRQRKILVAGAGIAGAALAYWLHHHGMSVTVVEHAPRPQQGRQTVDVIGAGLSVIRRMGLEPAARAAATTEKGLQLVDETGYVKAALRTAPMGARGPDAALELPRSELSALLYENTRLFTECVFVDEIVALTGEADRVHVTFKEGGEDTFTLVVAAGGLRSRTRDLVFGLSTHIQPLGMYTGYFTIPYVSSDDRGAQWHNAPVGRALSLRPDNRSTTRASLSFLSPPLGYERLKPDKQKELLCERFTDVGWQAPRMLAEMAAHATSASPPPHGSTCSPGPEGEL